jgi:hypothetical protein
MVSSIKGRVTQKALLDHAVKASLVIELTKPLEIQGKIGKLLTGSKLHVGY